FECRRKGIFVDEDRSRSVQHAGNIFRQCKHALMGLSIVKSKFLRDALAEPRIDRLGTQIHCAFRCDNERPLRKESGYMLQIGLNFRKYSRERLANRGM